MKMKVFLVSALFVVAMATCVYSCSEPEGGFKEPTPADVVKYAHHVVVGTVDEIITPDPVFQIDTAYGAIVTVQCSYKGGPLGGRIRIYGAGFIPGLCTSKDLVAGQNYVLFLYDQAEGTDYYEQSEMAYNKTQLPNILNVCGLNVTYPMENGVTLKRKICPEPSRLETCSRPTYLDNTIDKATPPAVQNAPSAKNAQDDPGNTGVSVITTTSMLAMLLSIVSYMML